ncbi:MAG: hypothetical protein NC543_03380 [bacterium]|nr:hypothetical protein [bacterium]MCM1373901.1 hypothetical protein [Muribaculum sp.]
MQAFSKHAKTVHKIAEALYPSGILAAALVSGSDVPKAKALQEAIPAEIILIGGAVSEKCSQAITKKSKEGEHR